MTKNFFEEITTSANQFFLIKASKKIEETIKDEIRKIDKKHEKTKRYIVDIIKKLVIYAEDCVIRRIRLFSGRQKNRTIFLKERKKI